MPRTGGEADKFGNRYESLWVVDAALDLIDGEYVDLVVEAVGDEAAGVEFFRTNPSGTREYHSVKRQQAGGNWTISRLTQGKPPTGRSILGDLIRKVQEGAVGVFSSGTSASELEKLRESALPSESHEEFQKRISGNGHLSGRFYESIVPICGDAEAAYFMLRQKSLEPHVVQAGARQIALAALWVGEARGDEVVVLEMGEEARAGAATVYARNLSDQTVGAECEKHLRTLFEDESDLVRREASRCWVYLQPDQIASRGSLIGAFAQSLRSASDVSLLSYRLKEARRPLPAEVCDLAEHAIAAFGLRAASIQYAEAGAAGELAVLMVRLHEQTNDPIVRERVLNTMDEMIRTGFYGIDEQLRNQYDR